MATIPGTATQAYLSENRYFRRAGVALVAVGALGFAAFNLAGITDITVMPRATHAHAAAMVAWLAVFVAQVWLATGGRIAAHRALGRVGFVLAIVVVLTGYPTIVATFAAGRVPPFFPPGYFFTLGLANITLFALFAGSAFALRRRTDWHKRLMIGALVMVYEPVLGRVLPFFVIPVLGGPDAAFPAIAANREAFELFRVTVHLAIALALLVFDRRASGRVHPATILTVVAVLAIYALSNGVGMSAGVTDYAVGLMPAAS